MTMIIPASVWERCTGIPLNNSTPSQWQTLWTAFTRIFLQRASLLQNLLCECQINFSVFERFTHNFLFQRWPCPAVCGLFEGISSSCWQRPGLSGNFHPPTIASGTCFLYQLCLFHRFSYFWHSCGSWRGKRRGREDPRKTKKKSERPSKFNSSCDLFSTMICFFSVEALRSRRAVRAHPKPQRLPKAPKRRRSPRTKKVWRRRRRRARRRRTRKAVKTSSDLPSAMLRWWPKIGVIEKSNGRRPSWRHWWSLIEPWLKWAGRGRYLVRDIMIWVIEVLIK